MTATRILNRIPLDQDLAFLSRTFRIALGSNLEARLSELIREAREIARPKAVYREITIREIETEDQLKLEGIPFKSQLLCKNLCSASRLFAFVATCGTEIEAWSRQFNNLVERLWTDTLMQLALGAAIQFLEKDLASLCGGHILSHMNPGSLEDWPLTEQVPLFQLIGEAPAMIGVSLTPSCLIVPIKSVSGIYFDAPKYFCNCRLCPREHCQYRQERSGT